MSRFVVDASVAASWWLLERYTGEASLLQSGEHELIAPDFLAIELTNIAVQKMRYTDIRRAAGLEMAAAISTVPNLRLVPSLPLLPRAFELARRPPSFGLRLPLRGPCAPRGHSARNR